MWERVPVHLEEFNAQLKLWIAVDAYPTPDGGLALFFRDVTQHRAALLSIQAERERFSRFAATSGLGVCYCDLPFADLIWDKTVKEHFWLPPEAHVTIDTFYERIHPDDREFTRQSIALSNQGKAPYDIEYRTTDPTEPSRVKWIRAVGWIDYKQTSAQLQKLLSEKDELNKLLALANHRAEEIWGAKLPTGPTRDLLQAFHIDTGEPYQITGMKLQTQLFRREIANDPAAAMTPARVQGLARHMDRGLDQLTHRH